MIPTPLKARPRCTTRSHRIAPIRCSPTLLQGLRSFRAASAPRAAARHRPIRSTVMTRATLLGRFPRNDSGWTRRRRAYILSPSRDHQAAESLSQACRRTSFARRLRLRPATTTTSRQTTTKARMKTTPTMETPARLESLMREQGRHPYARRRTRYFRKQSASRPHRRCRISSDERRRRREGTTMRAPAERIPSRMTNTPSLRRQTTLQMAAP